MSAFSLYDLKRLKAARDDLQKVLMYYYCDPATKRFWRRLDTVVTKLSQLIDLIEKEGT